MCHSELVKKQKCKASSSRSSAKSNANALRKHHSVRVACRCEAMPDFFFFFSHAYLAWIACVHPYVAFKRAGGKPYDACWPWLHCLVLKAVKHNGAHKHDTFTTGLVQQSTRISAYNRLSKLHSGAHKHTRNKETARMRRNKHPADTCEVMIDSMRSYGLSLD